MVTGGEDGPELESIVQPASWPARAEMVARCVIPREHEAPVANCTCGLYAVAELTSVPLQSLSGSVLGCVALWGAVVEGERGWRAARGYPVVLFADPSFDEDTRRRLGERYGVAVFTLPTRLGAELFAHSPRLDELARAVREVAARPRWPTGHPQREPDPELRLAVDELLEEIQQAELSRQRGSRARRTKRALVPVALFVTAVISAVLTGWPLTPSGQPTAPASLAAHAPAAARPLPAAPPAVATRETIVTTVPSPYRVRISRDGEVAAATYVDGSIEVWNLAGGGLRRVPVTGPGNGGGSENLVLTPDGRTIISAIGASGIRIYDTTSGSLRATLPTGWADYLAVSPDGRTLAHRVLGENSTIYLWNIDTRTKVGTLAAGRSAISLAAFNSDGTKLATGGAYQPVQIWDVASGAQIAALPPAQEMIPGKAYPGELSFFRVAFSPDGHTLATVSGSDGLRLWDLTTRRQVASLQVPDDPVSLLGGLTFSPDGRVLAVGTNQGIRLWNVATRTLIPTRLPGASGHAIAFLPDGNSLLDLSGAGTLARWSLTTG